MLAADDWFLYGLNCLVHLTWSISCEDQVLGYNSCCCSRAISLRGAALFFHLILVPLPV